MKRLFLLLTLIIGGAIFSLKAQEKLTGQVELLEIDETTATFRSEGFSGKKKEVIEVAKKTVFHKLFHEGVEGFNEDRKLIENDNKFWLENFFKGEKAPYHGFVKGAQLEGEVEELPTGEFHGFANIVINHEALIRTMKINKLIIDENAPIEEPTPKPKKKFGIRSHSSQTEN